VIDAARGVIAKNKHYSTDMNTNTEDINISFITLKCVGFCTDHETVGYMEHETIFFVQ